MKRWSLVMALTLSLAGCGGNSGAADAATGVDGGGIPNGSDGSVTAPDGGAGSCGTCPSGYTCGSANGIAVCRAPTGVPLFSHVILVLMENTSLATLKSDATTNTPYLHGLLSSAASSSDYHGVTHPSLPNYIALTSGSPGVQADGSPVACDCAPQGMTCMSCSRLSTVIGACGCEQSAQHLGDQLDAAHLAWRAYGESMGTACNLAESTDYAPRHLPFLYYKNVQEDSARCTSHVVDYSLLSGDLAAAPSLIYIAPNLTDDMHGTSLLTLHSTELNDGDKWLMANIPSLMSSAAYKDRGLLVIVWDEDDDSGGLTGNTDDPIPMFVLSPLAKSGGYVSATHADHYALLATIEDGLALPRLGNAAKAQPITDFFPDK